MKWKTRLRNRRESKNCQRSSSSDQERSGMHDPPQHSGRDRKRTEDCRCQPHSIAVFRAPLACQPSRCPGASSHTRQDALPGRFLSVSATTDSRSFEPALDPCGRIPRVRPQDRKPARRPYAESPAAHRSKNPHRSPPGISAFTVLEH